MTNPTPHGQVPDTLIDLIDAYAETRYRYGGIYSAKTEAARNAVIEALSGVQALSAAPVAFLKSVIALCSHRGYSPANIEAWDKDDKWIADLWRQAESMLAASPTPPAEQQAPRCSYCDSTGDVHGIDGEWRGICTECDAGTALRQQAAPKTAPVAQTAPAPGERCQHCIDRHDGIYGSWAAPCPYHDDDGKPRPTANAAPQQEAQEPCPTCAALARTVMLDQVSFDRKPDCYGIRQITDDESVEEWEDIRTSPDVAREEANDMMATGRGERYEVVPLWTTPQPAPDCHHRPPCDECRIAAQGGK